MNLIERIYNQTHPVLDASRFPDTTLVELCSAAEHALNYMHTGNTAVIATSVMKPLWVGNAIIQDGLPCFNPHIVSIKVNSPVSVMAENWPYDEAKYQPKSSSSACQIFTYGNGHFNVSCNLFHLKDHLHCNWCTAPIYSGRNVRHSPYCNPRTFFMAGVCAIHPTAICAHFLWQECAPFTLLQSAHFMAGMCPIHHSAICAHFLWQECAPFTLLQSAHFLMAGMCAFHHWHTAIHIIFTINGIRITH